MDVVDNLMERMIRVKHMGKHRCWQRDRYSILLQGLSGFTGGPCPAGRREAYRSPVTGDVVIFDHNHIRMTIHTLEMEALRARLGM